MAKAKKMFDDANKVKNEKTKGHDDAVKKEKDLGKGLDEAKKDKSATEKGVAAPPPAPAPPAA